MYTIKEEIYIIIYSIMFGIYIFSNIDIIDILIKNTKNKILKIIIPTILIIIHIYVTFIFSYNLMDGYMTIYFILFMYIAFLIYNIFIKKYFKKIILLIYKVLIYLIKQIIKIVKPFIYSKTIIKFIKREIKIIKKLK